MMKHDKLLKLVLAALFAALTCVATSLISIPIPATNGYINLGDGMVLLSAFLLGYAAYAPGTLVIKAAMALCAALLFGRLRGKARSAALAAGLLGEAVMVLGYFTYESVFLSYGLAAAASIPANCLQGAGGVIAAVLVYHALNAVPSIRKLTY